jgi:hypothetical protein
MFEKEILEIIYPCYTNEQITKAEDPDFYIQHIEGHKFGVEVTRYFHSESKARLKYIPNYGLDLLNGKPYRHKDDKNEIPVEDMIVTSADGKSNRKIKGIFHRGRILNEISKNIETLIKIKNHKYLNYNKELNHINLIIYDFEDCLSRLNKEVFLHMLFNKHISTLIKNSPFREIYFLTSDNENAIGYIPLKILHFSSQMLCFKKIFIQFAKKYNLEKSSDIYYNHFLIYLSHLDFSSIHYISNDGIYYFYYADSCLFIKENRIHINALRDNLYPRNSNVFDINKGKNLFDKRYDPIIDEFFKKTIGFLELFIKI